jgi:5-methylcytosine-specific restriction enzyme A
MTAKLSNPAAAKDPRKSWYGLALWKARRANQLAKEPLCRLCLDAGEVTGATIADHRPPCGSDFNAFVQGNLRSLCSAHHDALSGFVHRGYRPDIGADGFPLDPNHP